MPQAGQGIGPRRAAPRLHIHAAGLRQRPHADVVALEAPPHDDAVDPTALDLPDTTRRKRRGPVAMRFATRNEFRRRTLVVVDLWLRIVPCHDLAPVVIIVVVPRVLDGLADDEDRGGPGQKPRDILFGGSPRRGGRERGDCG